MGEAKKAKAQAEKLSEEEDIDVNDNADIEALDTLVAKAEQLSVKAKELGAEAAKVGASDEAKKAAAEAEKLSAEAEAQVQAAKKERGQEADLNMTQEDEEENALDEGDEGNEFDIDQELQDMIDTRASGLDNGAEEQDASLLEEDNEADEAVEDQADEEEAEEREADEEA